MTCRRFLPWTWCIAHRHGCVLRRGHIGRHMRWRSFTGYWFDLDEEGTP